MHQRHLVVTVKEEVLLNHLLLAQVISKLESLLLDLKLGHRDSLHSILPVKHTWRP